MPSTSPSRSNAIGKVRQKALRYTLNTSVLEMFRGKTEPSYEPCKVLHGVFLKNIYIYTIQLLYLFKQMFALPSIRIPMILCDITPMS